MGRIKRKASMMAVAGIGLGFALREAVRMRRTMDLKGKVVLITGGSRGLGLLLAGEFARCGAKVAIAARDPDELTHAHSRLLGRNCDAFTVTCDLRNVDDIHRMVEQVTAHFGRIDVLVNNAGVIQVAPMEEMTEEDYREAMDIHFWACLRASEEVLPQMRSRKSGRIVNIASIGGKVSVPHMLPYNASKFAMVGLSEGMRSELSRQGVYVTTVCPGLMRTGSHENAAFKGQNDKEYAAFSTVNALPAASMDAQQAARQIVEACSRGDAEIVLSPQAQLMALFHGLFPGTTADLLGLANRFMPGPGGIGRRRATGAESHSSLSPNPLTQTIQAAAAANNEI